jgi:hypothetical protein
VADDRPVRPHQRPGDDERLDLVDPRTRGATQLAEGVGSPFTLSELIAVVQRRDPAGGRRTISPVVQGMAANAGKGPESLCGKVFLRVGNGRYVLRGGWRDTVGPGKENPHGGFSVATCGEGGGSDKPKSELASTGPIADFDLIACLRLLRPIHSQRPVRASPQHHRAATGSGVRGSSLPRRQVHQPPST